VQPELPNAEVMSAATARFVLAPALVLLIWFALWVGGKADSLDGRK
jgi:hypothetical protein